MTVVDSPPGMIKRVDALQDPAATLNRDRASAGALKRRDVLDDVALQRQYADAWHPSVERAV